MFLLLPFLLGCSPRYEVVTNYIPSPEKSFAACLQIPEKDQTICRQMADMQAMVCQTQAASAYSSCKSAAANTLATCKRDPKAYCFEPVCIQSSCPADYSTCTATYERGYSACGGKVEKNTVCVARCDK